MNEMFLLYLMTRADAIQSSANALAFVAGAAAVVCVFAYGMSCIEHAPYEVEPAKKALSSWAKRMSVCCLIFTTIYLAIPSRNDLIFISGGSAILQIAKSDQAKEIGQKTLNVIEKYLDEAAK